MKTKTVKPLEHKYTEAAAIKDISGILGYQRCLLHLLNHVGELTQWKPQGKVIDAVELTQMLQVTADELSDIANASLKDIDEKLKSGYIKNY